MATTVGESVVDFEDGRVENTGLRGTGMEAHHGAPACGGNVDVDDTPGRYGVPVVVPSDWNMDDEAAPDKDGGAAMAALGGIIVLDDALANDVDAPAGGGIMGEKSEP
ncbi:MAG: hypothetical protein SGARI_004470 [Bacillariaceae sp.]